MARVGLRRLGWRKVLLAIGLMAGLMAPGVPAAAAGQGPGAHFMSCSYDGMGMLTFMTNEKPSTNQAMPSGNIYVFDQEIPINGERSGWWSRDQETYELGFSPEPKSVHGGGHIWSWQITINLDYVPDLSHDPLNFDRTKGMFGYYYFATGDAVFDFDHGPDLVVADCLAQVPVNPSEDDYSPWGFEKPGYIHDQYDGFDEYPPLQLCVRHVRDYSVENGWGSDTFVILNYGDVAGTSTSDFVLPPAGAITFADGVRANFSQAFIDDQGRWLVRVSDYNNDHGWGSAFPAKVEIEKEQPYLIDAACASPIVLDLDRSGSIERVSGDFDFDIDNDGEAERLTQWIAPGNAFLVDMRADGPFSGYHLFGDERGHYESGYEKLAELDTNNDAAVSGDELDDVGLWFDNNQNTTIDHGELVWASDYGIQSLSVTHENFLSTAVLDNGETVLSEDVWFSVLTEKQ